MLIFSQLLTSVRRSNRPKRSFKSLTNCSADLLEDIFVNPTISAKRMLTFSIRCIWKGRKTIWPFFGRFLLPLELSLASSPVSSSKLSSFSATRLGMTDRIICSFICFSTSNSWRATTHWPTFQKVLRSRTWAMKKICIPKRWIHIWRARRQMISLGLDSVSGSMTTSERTSWATEKATVIIIQIYKWWEWIIV